MRTLSTGEHLPSSPYRAYLEESRKPIVCLAFCLPIFLVYHAGVWVIAQAGPVPWQNGADVLLQESMRLLGLGGPLVSLFLVIIVFLLLQQASGTSWRVRPGTLVLMLFESLLFALPPFVLGKLVREAVDRELLAAGANPGQALAEKMILSLGAGVYEEFLFRMLLMAFLFAALRWALGWKGTKLYITAVLMQAILFALFHHLPGSPLPLSAEVLSTPAFHRAFAFRTVAGVYFAYLYQERGFGIVAGSHAIYDIIAVALNAFR